MISFRNENQTLLKRIENLEKQLTISNPSQSTVGTTTEIDNKLHIQRKDFLEFIYKNEGKPVLFTTKLWDIISKLIFQNDTSSHPNYNEFLKEF